MSEALQAETAAAAESAARPATAPVAGRSFRAWPLLLLLALIAAIYSNTLGNPFLYDDVPLVASNPEIASPTGVAEALGFGADGFTPRPRWTRVLVYALIYCAVGPSPPLYHACNIALHACVGLLVFLLVARLSGDRMLGWCSAALFALHPIATDVVTPVAGLRELLAASFGLAALLCMDRFRSAGGARWCVLALLAFFLSISSKEVGIMLIPAFLLIELYRRPATPGQAAGATPLLARLRTLVAGSWRRYAAGLLAVSCATALLVGLSTWGPTLAALGSPSYYDATEQSLGVLDHARLVGTGLRLLLLPIGQSVDYFYDALQLTHPGWQPLEVVDLLVLAGALALTASGLLRLSWVGFGGAWFLILLLPNMGLVRWHDVFAERFLYMPSIGICIAAASLLLALARRPGWARPMLAVGVVLLCLLGSATVLRNRVWASELSLWQDAAERYPDSVRARKGLAGALRNAGRPDLALAHYEAAARILPSYAAAQIGIAGSLLQLGRVAEARAKVDEVVLRFPEDAQAWLEKGTVHDRLGELELAGAAYLRATELDPDLSPAYNNLGRLQAMTNDLPGALDLFQRALDRDPSNVDAMRNLATIYRVAYHDDRRAEYYEAMAALRSGSARR